MSNINLNPKVAEFIEKNIELIENKEWEEIYNQGHVPIGFTDAMLAAGIDPLMQGLNYIPNYFLYLSDIKSFIIPDHIKSIGYQAFENCYNLTSVTIGNNVTSLGEDAFAVCRKLTNVIMPSSVTSIGRFAFAYCKKLAQINYLGTKEEAITKLKVKDKNWREASNIQRVTCLDGEIDLT